MKSFKENLFPLVHKEQLAEDIYLLRFQGRLDFNPGQFVRVGLDHFGEIALALCSNPAETELFEVALRAVGSVSCAIAKVLPGENISVRGPFGNGWPKEILKKKVSVIAVGGTGLFAVRSLLFWLQKNSHKEVYLLAGFRHSSDILFLSELQNFGKKIETEIYTEYKSGENDLRKGLITEGLGKLPLSQKSAAFICGPEIMYKFCLQALLDKKVLPENIFLSFERRMECGIGLCQHCSLGDFLVCKDGPVFPYSEVKGAF